MSMVKNFSSGVEMMLLMSSFTVNRLVVGVPAFPG